MKITIYLYLPIIPNPCDSNNNNIQYSPTRPHARFMIYERQEPRVTYVLLGQVV